LVYQTSRFKTKLKRRVESLTTQNDMEREMRSKFIGKNFVFDHRFKERTQTIVSMPPTCKTADVHTNCINEGCHLFLPM
jgi:predicted sulfurtransferase